MRLFVSVSVFAAVLCAQGDLKEFSIRSGSSDEVQSIRIKSNTLEARNVTARQLIQMAYGLPPSRVAGPDWLDREMYDVHAVPRDDETRRVRTLIKSALIEKFRMSSHMERRQIDGYALAQIPGTAPKLGPPGPVTNDGAGDNGGARVTGKSVSMATFASQIEQWIGKPVFDETALTGHYRIDMTWDGNDAPSLDGALRSQLGLQLTPAQRQFDVLVIDHIERL